MFADMRRPYDCTLSGRCEIQFSGLHCSGEGKVDWLPRENEGASCRAVFGDRREHHQILRNTVEYASINGPQLQ